MLNWREPLGPRVTQEAAEIGLALENYPSVGPQWRLLCVPSSCSATRVWSGCCVRKIPVPPGDAGLGDCPTCMRPCQSPGHQQANMPRQMRGVMGARCWCGDAPGHPCVSPRSFEVCLLAGTGQLSSCKGSTHTANHYWSGLLSSLLGLPTCRAPGAHLCMPMAQQ